MTSTPKLKAPPGTCDTHMHVYEPGYPARPEVAKPPVAPVTDYLRLCKRLGIARTVFVQPNAYGADNSCMLAAMKAYGPNARGVAVVTPDVSDAELDRLTKAGIRAIRFMLLPGGPLSWDVFDTLTARVRPFGWHVNLQIDGRTFAEHEAQLRRLPGNLVVDHVGKFLEPVPTDHPGFRALLRLLETGRTWVKLSAPYEVSRSGAPLYSDVGVLAKALVNAAPDRMLWASNWPHPSAKPEHIPDDADLLDLLLGWAPDEATRRKILVDNPARLYGF
ncbi:MAG TPA: amidohydrolase family protein [Alphaproteobacteria bacterium]|nr:amidohydrolase family protein [Alphaproteobacteria bacterium]